MMYGVYMSQTNQTKEKPITPSPKKVWLAGEWNEAALQLAASFSPPVYACKKCDAPVLDGYCCTYCGTSDPQIP